MIPDHMQRSIILSVVDIQGDYSVDNDLNSLTKIFSKWKYVRVQ